MSCILNSWQVLCLFNLKINFYSAQVQQGKEQCENWSGAWVDLPPTATVQGVQYDLSMIDDICLIVDSIIVIFVFIFLFGFVLKNKA